MKKIYLLFCILATGYAATAQTFANAGMETWRSGISGLDTPFIVTAPVSWFGFDSLIIADGETFGGAIGAGNNWSAQLFQDTSIKHGGASSAKLMTLQQDVLGLFPGILSNAQPAINVIAVIGGASPMSALSYSGGTAVTQHITSVSAWVQYKPGVDSLGMPAQDTGIMIVQALAQIGGIDSVVGTGTLIIPPTGPAFMQVTDTIVYTTPGYYVDTIRVNFASSGGATTNMDSSTLWVDDVTMVGVYQTPASVKQVVNNDAVKVYPNPANTTLTLEGPQNAGLSCQVYAVSGQVVITKTLTGNDVLDVTNLPAGMYFYAISDKSGNTIQHGKVTVAK